MPVEIDTETLDDVVSSGDFVFSVLKKRADFLRAARGKRCHLAGFVLQGWNRKDDLPPRVGFTCSKKVGNAVARNRAKRRLRAIARDVTPKNAKLGWDYVLIGRNDITANLPYPELTNQLAQAFVKLHQK